MVESFRWLFVERVPLLYEKKRVARQFQVEMWLDPSPIINQLGMRSIEAGKQDTGRPSRYIV